jgi:uncharacterized membrane protein
MRRSKPAAVLSAAGGVIAFTAAKAQLSASRQPARATFLVNASPEQAYDLWRNFEALPRFMAHLKSVRLLSEDRSEWIAHGPMDADVRWTAQITEDEPGQKISWRSLPGSQIPIQGSVEFRAHPQNRGTLVTAQMQYSMPAGLLGKAFATFMGKHPEFMVKEDLRRFKALLEAGETPTTVGQTHGPRGLHGRAEQVLFRETSNHPQPQAATTLHKSA